MTEAAQDPTRLASRPPDAEPAAATVRLSLSEIGSLVLRAVRGAGRGWGEAEEAGEAAQWLARRGLPWAEAFLSRLDGPAGHPPRPTTGDWQADGPVCALKAGIALSDFAALPEGPGGQGLRIAAVLDPLLILPFAARAARALGRPLAVEWEGEPAARIAADGTATLRPAAGSGLGLRRDLGIRLAESAADSPDTAPLAPGSPRPVPVTLWQALDARALGMTVPTSAQSLAGAGAGTGTGGDDND